MRKAFRLSTVAAQAIPAAESMPGESEPLPVTPHKKAVPLYRRESAAKSVPAKQEILAIRAGHARTILKKASDHLEGEDLDVPTYLRKTSR